MTSWREKSCSCSCRWKKTVLLVFQDGSRRSWVVLGDCVKTSDRCNDVSISLSIERDYVQGEV